MTPNKGERLRVLLERAMMLEDSERTRFLEEASAGDVELRRALSLEPSFLPNLETASFTEEPREPFAGNARFQIRRALGSGGFGDVYEAVDRPLGLTVALKVLRGLDPGVVESFKRGFRVLDRLAHPNLCQIYELVFDEDTETWLLTMEQVTGEPITQYLAAHSGQLRSVFRQVAQGLQALHQAGVLHCDIKPANVLVTPEGRAVLVDFGLARPVTSGAQPAAVTREYAAPELLTGEPFSLSSDWYAVGVMLEQVLPGSPEDLTMLAQGLTHRNPGARPAPAEILRVLCPGGPAAEPAPAEMVIGREPQLQLVAEVFGEVLRGQGRVCHITGVSGIGKSVFAAEAVARLRRAHAAVAVFAGACYQGESLPFKALDEVAGQIAAHLERMPLEEAARILPPGFPLLARLFPALEPLVAAYPAGREESDVQELRRRAFAAFGELITRLASRQPVVLLIDDLQWGDLDSSLLLRDLMFAIRTHAVLLLLLSRPEEQAPGLDLLGAHEIQEIALAPLTPAQSRFVAESWISGPALTAVVEESGGSPFFLRQLAMHAREAGTVSSTGDLIQQRLAALPAAERKLLEVLAVADAPVATGVLQQVAEAGGAFLAARSALVKGAFARTASSPSGATAAYHDRIAEALRAALPASRARYLHERLAVALEAAGDPDMARVATHYYEAGLTEAACSRGRLAAERAAAALAFDRAARLFQTVLAWAGPGASPAAAASLERAAGEALANCGRGLEAARAFGRALTGAPAAEVTTLRVRAAAELLRAGEMREGMEKLRALLAENQLPCPAGRARGVLRLLWERLRVEVRRRLPMGQQDQAERMDLCWAAAVGTGTVYPLLTEIYCFVYLRLALESGDRRRLPVAWASYASRLAYVDDGELRQARTLLQHAERLAAAEASPYATAFVEAMWAVVEMLGGHWRLSHDHALRANAIFRESCFGVAWETSTTITYAFTGRILTGDWLANEREMPGLLREARDRGDLYTEVSLQLVSGYYATFLIRDQPDAAEAAVAQCLRAWPGRDFDLQQLYAFQALTDLDLYRGRPAAAWRRVEQTWPQLRGSGLLRLTLLDVFAQATRGRAALALAASGEATPRQRSRLLKVASGVAGRLLRCPAGYAAGLGRLIEAGVATVQRDLASARRLLSEAEVQLAAHELIPWLAVARLGLAPLLDGDAARQMSDTGMAWMSSQQIRKPECLVRMLFPSA